MKFLTILLNWLPFNGSKTKLGAFVTALMALYSLLQQVDQEGVNQLVALLTTSPVNWAGVVLILVGLLHRWLKAKYPEVAAQKWPE